MQMTSTQIDQPYQHSLFSHHERSRLLRLCTHLTGDPVAADDLVQETLVTAWQRLEQLTGPSGISAWVATIGGAVDFAIEDTEQANDEKGDKIFFDLDREASNIKGVLDLAGIGVGAVGFALGIVIVVIGGVARQLDLTLAPIGTKGSAAAPMAAVAQSG